MQFEFKSTDLNASTDQFLVGTEKTFCVVCVCVLFFFFFFNSILQHAGLIFAVHKILYSLILIFSFVSCVCVECIIK